MISATFESVCCCGCGRPYRRGAAIEKTRAGWVLASCLDARPGAGSSPFAGPAEIREILGRAKDRDALATAADRIRAMRGGGVF
jgi:hypothetical protein